MADLVRMLEELNCGQGEPRLEVDWSGFSFKHADGTVERLTNEEAWSLFPRELRRG